MFYWSLVWRWGERRMSSWSEIKKGIFLAWWLAMGSWWMAALKEAVHSTKYKSCSTMMHIEKEASGAKIKTQRWLQEFPSKLREWKRFNGISCSVKHFLSVDFISSNFCPVFIYEKEEKQEKCSFKAVHAWCSEGLVCCRVENEQSKAVTCDISVRCWWQQWYLQREFRQIRLCQGNNIWLWALC